MTADENKSEELKEDSQPDETTLDQDHKVAKRKGLGRRDMILLYLPVIILVGSYLLLWLFASFPLNQLDLTPYQWAIGLLVVLYLISISVSLFLFFNKIQGVKSYIFCVLLTIPSWLIIGFCTCGAPLPTVLNSNRSELENRFKLTLRALNEAQQVFAERNNGNYGTWQEMVDQGFIENQYSKENINEHYIISSFIVHNPSKSERALGKTSSFTITAIPKRTRNKLRTFAIGVESYPLVWVGSADAWSTKNVSLHDIELWEPLR
jgi:hypothetical protein